VALAFRSAVVVYYDFQKGAGKHGGRRHGRQAVTRLDPLGHTCIDSVRPAAIKDLLALEKRHIWRARPQTKITKTAQPRTLLLVKALKR